MLTPYNIGYNMQKLNAKDKLVDMMCDTQYTMLNT